MQVTRDAFISLIVHWSVASLLCVASMQLCAAEIEILGLFRDQAVVRVDGQRYTLKAGQSKPEGERLVSTDDGAARRYPLGVKLRSGYRQNSGDVVQVFRVTLASVQVGSIKLNNIQAVVLEGEHPQETLLDMSFLGQLKIDNTGEQMILQKKC